MSNLPAVDSVWGVVDDPDTWCLVDMNDAPSFRDVHKPILVSWFDGGDDSWTVEEFWQWVKDSGAVDITAIVSGGGSSIKCTQCQNGCTGRDHTGEACECHYCGGKGVITADEVVKLRDRLEELHGEEMGREFFSKEESKYESELTKCAEILQRVHPMGAVMGFGLLNVAQALQEVVDGASESALRELHVAIERGGLDLSCCMDCGAPVVCIPDGLPMCEGCATKAIASGKGLPELTDAERATMNAMPASLVEKLWNKVVVPAIANTDNDQPFTVEWLCEIGGEVANPTRNETVIGFWSQHAKDWILRFSTIDGWILDRRKMSCFTPQITTRGDVLAWLNVLGIAPVKQSESVTETSTPTAKQIADSLAEHFTATGQMGGSN